MGRRFLGSRFGNAVPVSPGRASSAVYPISDQYYIKQEGGWTSPISATGGTKVTSGDYAYHVFMATGSPQTFTVASGTGGAVTYLVIGGGGGGSNQHSGGAGAGGLRTNDPNSSPGGPGTSSEGDYTVTAGAYTVIVGDGGAQIGPGSNQPIGGAGGYSSFNDGAINSLAKIRSEGGGGGGNWSAHPAGGAGGSGGGGAYNGTPLASYQGINQRVANDPTTPAPVQGYPGGTWATGAGPGAHGGGGGGGAGAVGGNLVWTNTPDPNAGASGNSGGNGGNGRAVPAFPGPVVAPGIDSTNPNAPNPFATVVGPTGIYAGGGGGGRYTPRSPGNTQATGGTGGGGWGNPVGSFPPAPNGLGFDGVKGTGGGAGGGGREESKGGVGGHGVVMIRYSTS